MIGLILILLFIALPVAELYVIVQTSHAIGFLNALGLLIVISIFGAWLAKREGLRTWTRFNEQVAAGKVPSREIADGVCLFAAGGLMLTPGFITDVAGLLLLLPPIRAGLRTLLVRRFTGRGRIGQATHVRRVYDVSARDDAPPPPPRGELDQ